MVTPRRVYNELVTADVRGAIDEGGIVRGDVSYAFGLRVDDTRRWWRWEGGEEVFKMC